ncbi:MAG: DUF393 domain-containing protein [Betaproteobacteria bacterium]|nr:DUF393 domain-containing protein [Betaproteobacteria bacterium]
MKVYYNSACPVCKAGIDSQKKKESHCEVEWVDVHTQREQVADVGADIEFVRERLHVVNEAGRLRIGFDAFLVIWANSPKERWKAVLFGIPGVRQLGRLTYNVFAALLYRWNRAKKHW